MVKEDGLNQLFERFKRDELKGKKRFNLGELEDFLIDRSGGVNDYERLGGYQGLFRLLKERESQGEIVAIKSSPYNGRIPPLKSRWQLLQNTAGSWEEKLVFKLSHRLDLSYFLKRPALQTEELAGKLISLDKFLAEKDKREWASREERSLELFKDEKFISSSEGKKLLNQLKLSLSDLKAEKYSQMFVYWKKGRTIRDILILENHSSFIACKRALETGYSIFSYKADTLIYGEGKHIIDSLKFLEEITEPDRVRIKYAGDIDPEGLAIYCDLKDRYPQLSIELHREYYRQMILSGGDGYPLQKGQKKRESILKSFLDELKKSEEKDEVKLSEKVKKLWEDDLRLPQELITFEVLKSPVNKK